MSKYVQTNFTAADMLGTVKKEEVKVVKPKATPKVAKVESKPVEVVVEAVVEPEVVVEEVITEEVKLEEDAE
jgi:hypothetical protein